jgi:acyl-coenzyme A synthetase/AMP-(fatty) acid ligase
MGCPVRITIGYGLSEAGGACLISWDDTEEDTIGHPLPGVSAKILDEEDGHFYTPEDGSRIGGLYLSTKSLSSGRLEDTVAFELEDIDGVPYLATHDLVQVNEDGSMTCLGRTNQFFVMEDGKRFEAGLVENAFAARPGIKACAIVPAMFRKTHDTIPVLYVAADASSSNAVQTVEKALFDLFGQSEVEASIRLLEFIVITDALPYSSAGKIDTLELRRGIVKGDRYRIKQNHRNGRIHDIELEPVNEQLDGAAVPVNVRELLLKALWS